MKKVNRRLLVVSIVFTFMTSCNKEVEQEPVAKPVNVVKPLLNCLDCDEQPTEGGPGSGTFEFGHYYDNGGTTITSSEVMLYDQLGGVDYFWIGTATQSDQFYYWNYPFDAHAANDRAKSCSFSGVPSGYTYRAYDNAEGQTSDDWTSIQIKVNIPTANKYVVNSFEHSYEDAYVKVTYHYHNGLDGSVSRWESSH